MGVMVAFTLTITDQYQNMAEVIKDCPHLIKNAKKACKKMLVWLHWFCRFAEVQMDVS